MRSCIVAHCLAYWDKCSGETERGRGEEDVLITGTDCPQVRLISALSKRSAWGSGSK